MPAIDPQDLLEQPELPSLHSLKVQDDQMIVEQELAQDETAVAHQSTLQPEPATTSIAYSYPPAPVYPPTTPTLHRSPIAILSSSDKGRGVYATADISAGTLIDISPVLLLTNEEYYGGGKQGEGKGVEGSVLRGYVFTWKGKEGGMALALGMGSLFNHSTTPNVTFELLTSSYTIQYTTFKRITSGDELCIFYGHGAQFQGDAPRSPTVTDEGEWGGLGGMEFEESEYKRGKNRKRTEKEKKEWDLEIVPFEDLEWEKVTNIIDPENMPLTTFPCHAILLPARYAQLAFAFVRKHAARFDELAHLKRVRQVDRTETSVGADSQISVLLFPVHTAPPDFATLLASSSLATTLAAANIALPEVFQVDVPATIARTDAQAEEWGRVWPVQMVHIREGPKALPRSKGWERAKEIWIRREAEKVWNAAKEAGERGEHPIACHVADSFDPRVHISLSLPLSLARCSDTRLSSRNILCHAASNAIDSVAILDRANARSAPLIAGEPAPYLLTGLTVFMSHEPCLLCSMSLLHSRIRELYYVRESPGGGGCGSTYSVHENEGLNHKFEVWQWKGGDLGRGVGVGLEVELDC